MVRCGHKPCFNTGRGPWLGSVWAGVQDVFRKLASGRGIAWALRLLGSLIRLPEGQKFKPADKRGYWLGFLEGL